MVNEVKVLIYKDGKVIERLQVSFDMAQLMVSGSHVLVNNKIYDINCSNTVIDVNGYVSLDAVGEEVLNPK